MRACTVTASMTPVAIICFRFNKLDGAHAQSQSLVCKVLEPSLRRKFLCVQLEPGGLHPSAVYRQDSE